MILNSLPAGQANRICLLGAGNCNDVDLRVLAGRCAEILLVDLDAEAMARGVAHQGLAEDSTVTCLSGVDLTGLFTRLESLPPGSAPVEQLVRAAELHSPPELKGGFHVVASLCLLSQLVDAVLQRIPNQQIAIDLIQVVRQRHLQLLLSQCTQGGSAILFTEIVSSDTAPQLVQTDNCERSVNYRVRFIVAFAC